MIRVHVTVDLYFRDNAGGHVKCWQRLAEAAVDPAFDELDLTVHFLGPRTGTEALSDRVRHRFHEARLPTAAIPFLKSAPDHTDLARSSRSLRRALDDAHVVHATGAEFTFARTALAEAKRRSLPLTLSLHTDTASYARIFTRRTVEGLFGSSALTRLLNGRLDLPGRQQASMTAKLRAMAEAARHVMAPRLDWPGLEGVRTPVSIMRRGVDKARFTPTARDRAWLHSEFGAPEDAFVIAYAGRVDRGKNIGLLIEAAGRAADAGTDVFLILMGEGEDRPAAVARLGRRAVCPGALDQETVARVLAASDVLAFPSRVEVFSNTVVEAVASELPVLLTPESGMCERLNLGEAALECDGGDVDAWAGALQRLAADPQDRARRAGLARKAAAGLPSWADVLREDLLPAWLDAR
ncbi:MAG: glycosyltransferase [Rhodospirillales bacterium]